MYIVVVAEANRLQKRMASYDECLVLLSETHFRVENMDVIFIHSIDIQGSTKQMYLLSKATRPSKQTSQTAMQEAEKGLPSTLYIPALSTICASLSWHQKTGHALH
jgi:hypothetical protein